MPAEYGKMTVGKKCERMWMKLATASSRHEDNQKMPLHDFI